MKKEITRIGILGSGQMGVGIAQVAAQRGFQVILADQSLALAQKGKERVSQQLAKLAERGKVSQEETTRTLSAIQVVDSVAGLAEKVSDFGLVIEAVSESPELKFKMFRELDRVCAPDVILASNTSSISITAIASQTQRPQQVIGMHFMNPVPVMKLIEGIRGLQTSNDCFDAVKQCAEKMGKTLISVRDIPGFAVNRILVPMINEAITALYEGIASAEDIDAAMVLGTHQPMGPLALADFIGLDTCLAIMDVLHEGLRDSKYRASPLLRQYVAAGWLGKKVKRGFYQYE